MVFELLVICKSLKVVGVVIWIGRLEYMDETIELSELYVSIVKEPTLAVDIGFVAKLTNFKVMFVPAVILTVKGLLKVNR